MNAEILAGVEQVGDKVLEPYDDTVCKFLGEWSRVLRADREARNYPDVMAFAYWCRPANIQRLRQEFINSENRFRLGKGMIFHIAPSNVPVNAGFTYVFGLLAGNSNVVRVSTRRHPQILCMCRVLNSVLREKEYEIIRDMTSFVIYERDNEITAFYSARCAMRVIWGGDETIQEVRNIPIPVRSTELTFADRYSFGIIDGKHLENMDAPSWKKLIDGFYNDTYLMDQNACSTPHLLFWLNASKEIKNRFWELVCERAEEYDLKDSKVSEKFTLLCEKAACIPEIKRITRYENILYVVDIDVAEWKESSDDTPAASQKYRGLFGFFYQADIQQLEEVLQVVDERVQTCAVAGIDQQKLLGLIRENGCHGIDRIVPFGKTLDIGVYWDGYDLIRSMSRCIGIER